MSCTSLKRHAALAAMACVVLLLAKHSPAATVYTQTNLVSDGFVPAAHTEPLLKNPWGISIDPDNGPFWVSNQVTNTASLIDGKGNVQSLVVQIPQRTGGPQGPTGQVYNEDAAFNLSTGGKTGKAKFIFAGLDGTVTAWNSTGDRTKAVTAFASDTPAVYTGIAIHEGAGRLYVANNATNQIDVLDTGFKKVNLGADAFKDPQAPAGLSVFNVKNLAGEIYVTYATPGPTADEAEVGSGAVAVFDTNGKLLRHLASGGNLTSPWGMELAPAKFGDFGNALLVGNFSEDNGVINAFDRNSGAPLGTLNGADGQPLNNQDLWALKVGTGLANTRTDTVYFTAGVGDEEHGLFGAITAGGGPQPIPLPAAIWTAPAAGLLAMTTAFRIRRRQALA
jgi:uncharacterized protein (TIGR03118 family)